MARYIAAASLAGGPRSKIAMLSTFPRIYFTNIVVLRDVYVDG